VGLTLTAHFGYGALAGALCGIISPGRSSRVAIMSFSAPVDVSSVVTDLNGPLTVGTVGGYTATSNASSAKAMMATLVLAPA